MADAEYEAMSKFVRADRRFRMFLYVVVSLCFFAFIFILYEVHAANEKTQREITSKIDESLRQNKIQNEETRQYVTCLLLVPIQERSEELQRNCFSKVDQPGGLQSQDFQPTSVDEVTGADQAASAPSQNFDSGGGSSSYPDSNPPQNVAQRDISQEEESVDPEAQPNVLVQLLEPLINELGEHEWQNN